MRKFRELLAESCRKMLLIIPMGTQTMAVQYQLSRFFMHLPTWLYINIRFHIYYSSDL